MTSSESQPRSAGGGAATHETVLRREPNPLSCACACACKCSGKDERRRVWCQNEFAMEKKCLVDRYSLDKRENRGRWVAAKPKRKRKSRTMSRDESHGVVLTGYHSNAELLPKVGPRAPARPSAVDPEPTAPRWDIRVCAGRATAAQEGVWAHDCCFVMFTWTVCVRRAAGRSLVALQDNLVVFCPYWRAAPPSAST